MKRALVTGADGFLGRHLVPALERRGVAVTGLVRRAQPHSDFIAMGSAPWSHAALAEVVHGCEPDIVFHLAGCAAGDAGELEQSNVGITTSLLHALRDAAGHCTLVCCGSAAEYGAAITDGVAVCESAACLPLGPYGSSKLAQTLAVLAFARITGARVIVARIFNPIGPGMPAHLALGDFARQLSTLPPGGTLLTGNIDVYRDFFDVGHVAGSLIALAANPQASGIVNICSGEATGLRDLTELLIGASGKAITLGMAAARARPGEPVVITGSAARLAGFDAALPRTDYPAVMARLWEDARVRWARRP